MLKFISILHKYFRIKQLGFPKKPDIIIIIYL